MSLICEVCLSIYYLVKYNMTQKINQNAFNNHNQPLNKTTKTIFIFNSQY